MRIENKCNFCNKKIEDGKTFLNLYGQYLSIIPSCTEDKDYTDRIVKVDNVRPFWSLCNDCRNIIAKGAHDGYKIVVLDIKDTRD